MQWGKDRKDRMRKANGEVDLPLVGNMFVIKNNAAGLVPCSRGRVLL